MTSAASSKLFSPLLLGDKQLQHRVAMAPLTRFRSPKHVPMDAVAEYYGQRASKGGLLVTEATYISQEAGGMEGVPGIWNEDQIKAWKKVTDAVHAKEGVIYMQLWALGRANPGDADVPEVVSSSNLPLEGQKAPTPLDVEGIKRYVKNYAQAAKNAVDAGFDGVEIHSANGYLPMQFIESNCNKRTDNYGGSIENRIRFTQEIITEVCKAIGQQRTSVRFSPWTGFQGMGTEDTDLIIETYVKLCTWIRNTHPKFAAVHITEDSDQWRMQEVKTQPRSNDPFRAIFRHTSNTSDHTAEKIDNSNKPTDEKFPEPTADCPTLFISCGGYDAESATKVADAKGAELIAIGRYFISNPDLPSRIKNGQSWTKYDRPTFYNKYSTEGYTDYAVFGQEGHGEKVKRAKETAEAKL